MWFPRTERFKQNLSATGSQGLRWAIAETKASFTVAGRYRPMKDATHFRELAQKCRELAEGSHSEEAADSMRRMAKDFDDEADSQDDAAKEE